jgi:hypothetical protein
VDTIEFRVCKKIETKCIQIIDLLFFKATPTRSFGRVGNSFRNCKNTIEIVLMIYEII